MSTRVEPDLLPALKAYGAAGAEQCLNCGNCTAICPLSTTGNPFPRDCIRLAQVGLRDRLRSSLDPWLCYYCGECSSTCPRGAEPGETMMAVRRWLTAQYDWTGLARRLQTSRGWVWASLLFPVLLILLLATFFHGPVITERVALNTFAPVELIHQLDLILAGMIAFFLFSNLYRMHRLAMSREPGTGIPFSLYLREAWRLAYHFLTQARFSRCESRRRWLSHLVLVGGYVTMFLLIVVFLSWFQTDELYPLYHPQRWVGYLAALAILYGAGDALWGRLHKRHQMHRFSHPGDWLFPLLLVLMAVSGLSIHVFRYQGWPMATYLTYVAHLALMLSLYVCVGPMGKWSHLAYRPFAVYLQAVKEAARARQGAATQLAPAG
ncbi:MAG: 4Fe-4S ferredoxin [Candidatus Omnitrophica bacterium]|nr:4Fe-4S ferredoxin [Candidatus Omnitrophota bacterium]